jgi:hypothetical protein
MHIDLTLRDSISKEDHQLFVVNVLYFHSFFINKNGILIIGLNAFFPKFIFMYNLDQFTHKQIKVLCKLVSDLV